MKPRGLAIKLPSRRARFELMWRALGDTMWRTHLHTKRRARRIDAVMR